MKKQSIIKLLPHNIVKLVAVQTEAGNRRCYTMGLKPATLLKKRLWHRCFLVNFVNFLGTYFLKKTSVCYFCKN